MTMQGSAGDGTRTRTSQAGRLLTLVALVGSLAVCRAGDAAALDAVPEMPPAPALELPGVDGESHRLGDHAGSVVLVNFWATWCPPCVAEMPGLQRLADALDGRPFAVVGVNVGDSSARIKRFATDLGLDFPLLSDRDGDASRRWDATFLPTSYLVDREGRIRYRVRGEVEWDADEVRSVVEELLE